MIFGAGDWNLIKLHRKLEWRNKKSLYLDARVEILLLSHVIKIRKKILVQADKYNAARKRLGCDSNLYEEIRKACIHYQRFSGLQGDT